MAKSKLTQGRPKKYSPEICAKVHELQSANPFKSARLLAEMMPEDMPLTGAQLCYILSAYTATGRKKRTI